MNTVQPSSFAELAVELAVAQSSDADLAELAWATWVQCAFAGDRVVGIEVLAARIGMSSDATAHVIAAERKHCERIADAHHLLKSLIPHEAEVRAILARAEQDPAASVWRRLVDFVMRRKS